MAPTAPSAKTSASGGTIGSTDLVVDPDKRDEDADSDDGIVAETVEKATTFWQRFSAKPWVKHVLAAFGRFTDRLGTQFGAAITYFSFLSLIPILMVAFGATAIVLRGNQGALDTLKEKVTEQIPGDQMNDIIDGAVKSGTAIGIIGLVLALYSGIGWITNIREAVQAQWRPTFEKSEAEKAQSFLSILLGNLVTLVSLGAALLVSVVLTTVGGAAQNFVLGLLGLDGISWLKPVVGVGTFVIAIAADVLIFMWFYRRMEIEEFTPPPGTVFKGALIAAVAFEVLKVAMTFLLPLLSGSATAVAFGPIIVLLFFFNLVAQVVLFVAAWIATAPGSVDTRTDEDLPEIPGPAVVVHAPARSTRAGLLGIGAAAGFLAGRRRRR